MARGTVLTKDVIKLIAEVWMEHPDWRVNKIQSEVINRLHQVKPYVEPNWPGLSAVKKQLTKLRHNDDERPLESKRLDRPWSIGTLVKYEIVPEAILVLLKIQENRKNALKNSLTVREARWVSRLYKVTNNIKDLDSFASTYALEEHLSELTGFELDTSEIDSF